MYEDYWERKRRRRRGGKQYIPPITYEELRGEWGTSVRWLREENRSLRAEVRRLQRRQKRPWYRKLWDWMRRKHE